MAARDSIKGYLYQTLVALLKMFDDGDWTHVAIEPRELDEKVDIYWTGATSRAVQVKSSKSRVNEKDAADYIQELKRHHNNADEYELVLCAHVVATLKEWQ